MAWRNIQLIPLHTHYCLYHIWCMLILILTGVNWEVIAYLYKIYYYQMTLSLCCEAINVLLFHIFHMNLYDPSQRNYIDTSISSAYIPHYYLHLSQTPFKPAPETLPSLSHPPTPQHYSSSSSRFSHGMTYPSSAQTYSSRESAGLSNIQCKLEWSLRKLSMQVSWKRIELVFQGCFCTAVWSTWLPHRLRSHARDRCHRSQRQRMVRRPLFDSRWRIDILRTICF